METEKRILVVDDDYGILDTMKDVLQTEGFKPQLVDNGYEAIEKVKSMLFKAAIVDIKMPGMGGIGVLKAINEIDPTLPVIMFTGFATIETATEAIRLGAYDYIMKPFEWDKLLNIIKRAMEKRDLHLNNEQLLNKLKEANEKLKTKVEQLYKLNEIGKAMNTMLDTQNLYGYILNVATQLMECETGSLLLFDRTNYNLQVKVTKGLSHTDLKGLNFKNNEGFIGKLIKRDKKYFRPHDKIKGNITQKEELLKISADDFLSLPLRTKGKILGLLNLCDFKESVDTETNFHLGNIMAAQAATAIDNARLYEGMQFSYLSVMEVLINAMESKSEFTRGHSERVSTLSQELCQDLEISKEQRDHIKQASRLHDIGKMTISDFILNKPGKLSREEWEEIVLHPIRGSETLKPLGFLSGISPIVRAHHERFDGKGYPDGLHGEKIPLESRIISIVDSFDAMISSRPYRKALQIKTAIDEIIKNQGQQFDPGFAKVFVNDTFPRIKNKILMMQEGT